MDNSNKLQKTETRWSLGMRSGQEMRTQEMRLAQQLCLGFRSKLRLQILLMLVLAIPMIFNCPVVQGQIVIREGAAGVFRIGGVAPVELEDEEDEEVEGGATLKTDPDLEQYLARADRFLKDKSYSPAAKLWQIVLERSGDTLFSKDGKTYFSLVQQVEATIANLPPEAMRVYRVTADANAKEILAAGDGPDDVLALNRVVREYFLSSLGDDAAFDLSCIYLDKYDFNGARRMLEKILAQYPDPSVPLDQVYLRLAVCHSFLGNAADAQKSLEQASKTARDVDSRQFTSIKKSIGKLDVGKDDVSVEYSMVLGDSRRRGVMPSLPDGFMDQDLEASWQYYFWPRDTYNNRKTAQGNVLSGKAASGADAKDTLNSAETKMIGEWKDKLWRPSGNLLFDGKRMFFKSAADVVVWDTDQIAAGKAKTVSDAAWRPVVYNAFAKDDASEMLDKVRANWTRYNSRNGRKFTQTLPVSTSNVQLFGDKIFQQMSIHDGVLYNIEGANWKLNKTYVKKSTGRSVGYNQPIRRTRTNFLTAYDAATGALLWRLPAESDGQKAELIDDEKESPWLSAGGLMSAPISFGGMLIAPVNQGGAIFIYAFDPNDRGKTIWKSFLCDEPVNGSNRWSPIDISIEGSDLFVSCGVGVVFALDPTTGMVRFAKRYGREGKSDNSLRNIGWTNPLMTFDGWSRDIIIPHGRQMICFCSDSQTIEGFDRSNGETIWRSEMSPITYKVDYLIGIYNDVLYAGGRETVIAYDLNGEGCMIWGGDQMFGGKQSFGRGMVTPSGVYVPVGSGIIQFPLMAEKDSAGGFKKLAQVKVDLGTDGPVGNLYSDGKRIWVHGANRVFALSPSVSAKGGKSNSQSKKQSK